MMKINELISTHLKSSIKEPNLKLWIPSNRCFGVQNFSFGRGSRAFNRIIILVLLAFFIVGCFAPAIVTENNPTCQLVTRKLELVLLYEENSQALAEATLVGMSEASRMCQTAECLLIVPLSFFAISVTSVIVSGSIVVVGNTIHWIEKEGKCKNSTIRTIVNNFINSIKFVGGKTIQSTTELITWFKQHLGMGT